MKQINFRDNMCGICKAVFPQARSAVPGLMGHFLESPHSTLMCQAHSCPFRGRCILGLGAQQVPSTFSPPKAGLSVCVLERGSRCHLLCCRHMVLLKEQYGKQVVVNLLGNRGGEEVLNRAFKVNAALASFSTQGAGRGKGRPVGPRL